jgi:hypothetical protein
MTLAGNAPLLETNAEDFKTEVNCTQLEMAAMTSASLKPKLPELNEIPRH